MEERLGPYRLRELLGEGGMGVVHRAVDEDGREVALKVLRPELARDTSFRHRLAREVDTIAVVAGAAWTLPPDWYPLATPYENLHRVLHLLPKPP